MAASVNVKFLRLMTSIYNSLLELGLPSDKSRQFVLQFMYCCICDISGVFIGRRFYFLVAQSDSDNLIDNLNYAFSSLSVSLSEQFTPFSVPDKLHQTMLAACEVQIDYEPTLFGSFSNKFLSVADKSESGAFFTAAETVDKAINPLFYDELVDEFFSCQTVSDYRTLHDRICALTFLDAAAGCGNFLTATYAKLKHLECEIFAKIGQQEKRVTLNSFYGIELSEHSAEFCKLSLNIIERRYQIDVASATNSALGYFDIVDYKGILTKNALHCDWSAEFPEISYIIGNPPFCSKLTAEQRKDIESVLGSVLRLDYCACWLVKAAQYCQEHPDTRCSMVLTSSVSQGAQATYLWPELNKFGIIINFAYQPFAWVSDTENIADLTCVIIGFSTQENSDKRIYPPNRAMIKANHINGYLIDGDEFYIHSTEEQISNPSIKCYQGTRKALLAAGSFVTPEQMRNIDDTEHIYPYMSGKDMMEGTQRYYHTKSPASAKDNYIIIPRHSSEKRKYIPMVYLENTQFLSDDSVIIVPGADLYLFGILQSSMHQAFVKQFSGKLAARHRYSTGLCFNNFPFITPSEAQREQIEVLAAKIIAMQKTYSIPLGKLYMDLPIELDQLHRELDIIVDKMYAGRVLLNDAERVREALTLVKKLYEQHSEKHDIYYRQRIYKGDTIKVNPVTVTDSAE